MAVFLFQHSSTKQVLRFCYLPTVYLPITSAKRFITFTFFALPQSGFSTTYQNNFKEHALLHHENKLMNTGKYTGHYFSAIELSLCLFFGISFGGPAAPLAATATFEIVTMVTVTAVATSLTPHLTPSIEYNTFTGTQHINTTSSMIL